LEPKRSHTSPIYAYHDDFEKSAVQSTSLAMTTTIRLGANRRSF